MNNCQLDTLPVELIHHLLGYFSAHEIFHTFTNVTSYIDAVLASYTNYRVNFKAITRSHFDLVCQHLRPNHVIALTLSNGEDTPGLIGLFLSRFQINQFTRLQSLRLIDIGQDFWESIIVPMTTLKYLQSFCFFSPDRDERWVCNLSGDSVTQLDKALFDSYASILPQLYQLRLCHGDFLSSIQFPHLCHLELERSTIDLMKHISVAAPQLRSLNTRFSDETLPTELIYPLTQLDHLVLKIEDFPVPMNFFERMMSNLPRLKHLELITDCDNDVIDGHRWQTKVGNLITFKFRFYVSSRLHSRRLDSFRTSFWVEQRRWFVAYLGRCFFSVPHFIATEADDNFTLPQYTTVPDNEIFYQHVEKLKLTKKSSYATDHFPHVHTLILSFAPSLFTIKKIIDLRQVRNFTVSALRNYFPINAVINEMSNLRQISIADDVENFLKRIHYKPLDKIQTLQINHTGENVDDYNIEHLSAVFPCIEHLQIMHTCSPLEIFDLLCEFKYLFTASFRSISQYYSKDVQQSRITFQSTVDQMLCEQKLNYTYRLDSSTIYFWV